MRKGKIIVLEGLDCSFKETNSKSLYEYIKNNITSKVILLSFPNYKSDSSKYVTKFLHKEYGELKEVNPYTRTMLYALDRFDTIKEMKIEQLLEEGYYIILDRYTTSNLLFGSSDFESKEEKDEFIHWSLDLEYIKNKLPLEDIVIYLNMPVEIGFELIKKRVNTVDNDIHETNKEYLKRVERNASYVCEKFAWNIVNCTQNGQIRDKESIFNDIKNILKNKNIIE